ARVNVSARYPPWVSTGSWDGQRGWDFGRHRPGTGIVMRTLRWWITGAAAWLLLAATLARPDVIAAVAAGGAIAGFAVLGRRMGMADFTLRWRWLRHLPQLPKQV